MRRDPRQLRLFGHEHARDEWRIAIHEAGHAVAALELGVLSRGRGPRVEFWRHDGKPAKRITGRTIVARAPADPHVVSIIPDRVHNGVTITNRLRLRGAKRWAAEALILCAGVAAVKAVTGCSLGDALDGGFGDVEQLDRLRGEARRRVRRSRTQQTRAAVLLRFDGLRDPLPAACEWAEQHRAAIEAVARALVERRELTHAEVVAAMEAARRLKGRWTTKRESVN